MPETTVQLEELEKRVPARFYEKMAELWPLPNLTVDSVDWAEALKSGPGKLLNLGTEQEFTIEGTVAHAELQFPREQWVVYPHRRTITLLICDRMIDLWDDLTIEQKSQVGFLLTYGGRERVA